MLEKVIPTSEITFRLPNNFVLFIWDKFPLREKVFNKIRSYGTNIFPCTEISPINKRYLGTWENFLSHMNVSYLFILFSQEGEIWLVNLSRCFLANRDNFFQHEQALRPIKPYAFSLKESFGFKVNMTMIYPCVATVFSLGL